MSEKPQRIPRLGWAISFLVATGVMAFAFMQMQQRTPRPSSLERYAKAPDFALVAHDGTRLATSDLLGKVWVANFIFTTCKGPCPIITSRMAELQQALQRGKVKDVRLVSVTVDPANDTPSVLAAYAKNVGADPAMWKFVTGPPAQVEAAIRKGFLQSLMAGKDGEPIHSTRFVVVDKEGWMRAFPDGNDPEVSQKLLMDIGDVLRENPSAP